MVNNISQLKQLPSVLSTNKQCRCRQQRADLAPDHAALAKEAFELRRENNTLRNKVRKLEDRQETLLDIIQDRRGGDDPRSKRSNGAEL
jgi:cell division protein FtsB